MKPQCPESECPSQRADPKTRSYVRRGYYFRSSDGQWIRRYSCSVCGKFFSSATTGACYRQKKRKMNTVLFRDYVSGVSQRRLAKNLKLNRKTVVRKLRFLAVRARLAHSEFLGELSKTPLAAVQFDDLETSEHSKCKPLSVALAVDPKSRKILSYQVSQMPAKGLLARKAVLKYGARPDLRPTGWNRMFSELRPVISPNGDFLSDENPHYPRHLRRHFPECSHRTTPGGRGSIAGQGELKKLPFDPLFSLNHTCAMLRANMNRLFRKTWCTTKNKQGLLDHLALYVRFHNELLTGPCAGLGAS
jgi:transposase-like protein